MSAIRGVFSEFLCQSFPVSSEAKMEGKGNETMIPMVFSVVVCVYSSTPPPVYSIFHQTPAKETRNINDVKEPWAALISSLQLSLKLALQYNVHICLDTIPVLKTSGYEIWNLEIIIQIINIFYTWVHIMVVIETNPLTERNANFMSSCTTFYKICFILFFYRPPLMFMLQR